MKTIPFSLLMIIMLSGCGGGIASIPSFKRATVLNFVPFTERGFLFTPEPYQGEYESIGMITVTISASGERRRLRPGIYDWDWDLTQLQSDSVLTYFYERATVLGADAVVRFSLSPSGTEYAGQWVPTMVAHGFAIKRMKR